MTQILRDGRVELIPATTEMILVELSVDGNIASHLGVSEPAYWPPELNDEGSFNYALGLIESGVAADGWGFYYMVDTAGANGVGQRASASQQLVGFGGFKGAPSLEGQVEIGYSILTPHRRQGHATAMCKLLIEKAFREPQVQEVIATTLPALEPSIGVLLNLGFSLVGETDGIVTYSLPKARKRSCNK